jgi:hypothetical protein
VDQDRHRRPAVRVLRGAAFDGDGAEENRLTPQLILNTAIGITAGGFFLTAPEL